MEINKIMLGVALICAHNAHSQDQEWWFEMPKDKQICFRQCETHHDYVKEFDSWHDTTKYFDNPTIKGYEDYWICIDENVYGTKIFGKINNKNIAKAQNSIHKTNKD